MFQSIKAHTCAYFHVIRNLLAEVLLHELALVICIVRRNWAAQLM